MLGICVAWPYIHKFPRMWVNAYQAVNLSVLGPGIKGMTNLSEEAPYHLHFAECIIYWPVGETISYNTVSCRSRTESRVLSFTPRATVHKFYLNLIAAITYHIVSTNMEWLRVSSVTWKTCHQKKPSLPSKEQQSHARSGFCLCYMCVYVYQF